jgi:SPX domain protein involved in polyphosphate accumulation
VRKEADTLEREVNGYCTRSESEREKAAVDKFSARAKRAGNSFLAIEKFGNTNFASFRSVLEKHDELLPDVPCLKFYLAKLHQQSWIKDDFSKAFVILSKIHAKLRGEAPPPEEDLATAFTRKTTKYWIKTAHISKIKHIILRHLPVFQLNLDALHGDSQFTNSVYLDNGRMELYKGRLTKSPHAICIRLRWYDLGDPTLVFVERKTHEDTWTGDASVKERFALKENQVVDFLNGKYTLEHGLRDLAKRKPSEVEVEAFTKLFTEIAAAIKSKQLKPLMRTRCMRVAYQIPFQVR